MSEALLFLIGLLVSAFGTVVGFGGGVFMVPVLIVLFGFSVELAIGSVMVSLVPASLIASFFNYREKNIDYLVATLIQFPAVAGTVLGAFLVAFLPLLEMQFIFAFFVISVGFYFLFGPKKKKAELHHSGVMYRIRRMPTSFIRTNRTKHLAYRLNGGLVGFFGFFSGTVSGLFGIGGGFLQTPIMIKIFRMPPQIATSTSLFILIITSVTGSISHLLLGHVQWSKSFPLILAFAIGAFMGNSVKKKRAKKANFEKLIGYGLMLAGLAVILNLLIKYEWLN